MLLAAEHLSINFGTRQLLSDVNFYLEEGKKAGVIGINGTGKSTFLPSPSDSPGTRPGTLSPEEQKLLRRSSGGASMF